MGHCTTLGNGILFCPEFPSQPTSRPYNTLRERTDPSWTLTNLRQGSSRKQRTGILSRCRPTWRPRGRRGVLGLARLMSGAWHCLGQHLRRAWTQASDCHAKGDCRQYPIIGNGGVIARRCLGVLPLRLQRRQFARLSRILETNHVEGRRYRRCDDRIEYHRSRGDNLRHYRWNNRRGLQCHIFISERETDSGFHSGKRTRGGRENDAPA